MNTDTKTDQDLFNKSTGGKLVNKILARMAAQEAALDEWIAGAQADIETCTEEEKQLYSK